MLFINGVYAGMVVYIAALGDVVIVEVSGQQLLIPVWNWWHRVLDTDCDTYEVRCPE